MSVETTPPALEPERYELREDPPYRFDVDRRTFLGLVGAGVLIGVGGTTKAQSGPTGGAPVGSIAARLHLAEDGTVTILTGKVEVGQGSRTQITQAAAEELQIAPQQISVIMADTDLVPVDGGTWGSQTTPRTVPAVRRAAAAARDLLLEAAATAWKVDRARVEMNNGTAVERGGQRAMSYADLAGSPELVETLRQTVPKDVSLTHVDKWRALGTSLVKVDGRRIVTGTHEYPSDIRRPGMLYGKVLRPPTLGATLLGVDLQPALSMPGVVAVRDGGFAGCAAPTSREAQSAVKALADRAQWSSPEHSNSRDLYENLRRNAHRGAEGQRRPRIRERGAVEAAIAAAATKVSAVYEIAYIQHVPMEPRAAVAEWEGERLTVWTATQNPHGVRNELGRAFTVASDRVRVIVPDSGSAFGGKHTGECAVEAARLARQAGRPVSLQWTREEEFSWAYFRPAGVISITAGLGDDDSVLAWDFENINSGTAALVAPYSWPHDRSRFVYCDSPLREGSYRGIAATANNFARECFVDELAVKAGRDPLDYRLAHLEDERLQNVLKAAADRFGWQRRSRMMNQRDGIGIGIAGGTEKGSYVAACVELQADKKTGSIGVREICTAFECGAIQNPDNLRAQVDGAVIMGLGGALWEETRFEGGRFLNRRLSQYRVPRFTDVPVLDTVLLDRSDLESAGAGETPIIAVAPAIGNAVFHATGVRLRSMPLRGALLRA